MTSRSFTLSAEYRAALTRDAARAARRAGVRARELSIATGTTLVVNRRGKTIELDPNTMKPVKVILQS